MTNENESVRQESRIKLRWDNNWGLGDLFPGTCNVIHKEDLYKAILKKELVPKKELEFDGLWQEVKSLEKTLEAERTRAEKAENLLKEYEQACDHWQERIDKAEKDLAEAVGLLHVFIATSECGNYVDPNDADRARDFLTRITGGKKGSSNDK